jgi:16S rRNA (uracil1498-N3)-methyltransferase
MTHLEVHYLPPGSVSGSRVSFPPDEVRHIASVLRKRPGDVVWAVDGLGAAHEVSLTRVSVREVSGEIIGTRRGLGEGPASVTLAAAVLKGDRFDWLVEKSVELGVSRIAPFVSAASTVRLSGAARIDRWRHKALAAMKQCGRSVQPEILPVTGLEGLLGLAGLPEARFVAHSGPGSMPAGKAAAEWSRSSAGGAVLLAVGPEGGFLDAETERLTASGFVCVTLGSRRLRSETAAVSMLAAFNAAAES